jgi:uncharacterized membrane protein YbhN (UPF0104 family)
MVNMIKRIPWRPLAAIVILLATFIVFFRYMSSHPEVLRQLKEVSLPVIAGLLVLYAGFVGSLALINTATLRLCRKTISTGESLLLTMYSSVINFFGPLQSGPAFRALYLKQKHGLKFRDYTAASFVYYLFYALFSGLFLVSGLLGWWLAGLIAGVFLFLALVKRYNHTWPARLSHLAGSRWYLLAFASLLQVSFLAVIYYIELNTVSSGVSLSQAVAYTGAANFALFVALTPGAIGFRESFLIFSQNIHHVDAPTIIAANLLDRAVYIVLLLIIAILIFGTHANRRFRVRAT